MKSKPKNQWQQILSSVNFPIYFIKKKNKRQMIGLHLPKGRPLELIFDEKTFTTDNTDDVINGEIFQAAFENSRYNFWFRIKDDFKRFFIEPFVNFKNTIKWKIKWIYWKYKYGKDSFFSK